MTTVPFSPNVVSLIFNVNLVINGRLSAVIFVSYEYNWTTKFAP